ncbi:hypothetical protein C5609_15680 [Pseudomonas putida]|uniref:hypothetical protein n=1 Tax=Pseudomonas putida TaxID=303 RepID=UPI00106F8CEB|nr:hypothetical protein [Pseudomonas putida]TFF51028.1 hypothetical protein C5609_15680 [Pseudomonas putida]
MSDETFDVAAFAAQQTGTDGISDDAGYDQPVSDALADNIERYDEFAERRDAHLTDPDAEQLDDPVEPTGKERRVPLAALQQERAQRQQLQQELEAQRQQVQQLQAYQQQVQAFLAQQQQVQIPNFEDDPQGHVEAVQAQMQAQLQAVQQQVHQQQAVAHVQAEATAVAPVAAQAEAAMAAEVGQENYAAAFEHVRQHVQQELMQRFPGASPQDLATVETAAGIQFIRQCQQMGIDPARHIYEKAQALGFVPSGQRVPGQQRRAAPTSLSNIPAAGRAPDQRGKLTARDIASMPQDEFDKLFESMRDEQRPQF